MEIQLNSDAPYSCFTVNGDLTTNGAKVLAYPCSDGPAQQWYFSAGRIVGLGTNGASIKCLTAAGTTVGSGIEIPECAGKAPQQWLMVNGSRVGSSNNAAVITLAHSDLCVDSSGPLQPLLLNTCTAGATQDWIVR